MFWIVRKFTSKFKIICYAVIIGVGGVVIPASAQIFDLQAHRGGRGNLPENTLAAFENAIRMGVRTLEMDIAITADGVPVISHDAALNPAITRDAKGQWLTAHKPLIKDLKLADVQTYDVGRLNPSHPYAKEFSSQQPRDGQRIPTLASVFELVNRLGADDIQFDIETKINPHYPQNTLAPEAFIQTILSVFRQYDMTRRIMVQSFDWRTLEILHRVAPEIRTMYLTIDFPDYSTVKDSTWTAGHLFYKHNASVPKMIKSSAGDSPGVIWGPNYKNLSLESLREAHEFGMLVIPWTVNDIESMRQLIELKVDGLITDYPDRLRIVMGEKGIHLPAPKPISER